MYKEHPGLEQRFADPTKCFPIWDLKQLGAVETGVATTETNQANHALKILGRREKGIKKLLISGFLYIQNKKCIVTTIEDIKYHIVKTIV